MTVSSSSLFSDCPFQSALERKIRNGSEPDNPLIIKVWLDSNTIYCEDTKALRLQYTKQFYLLLETVLDELLPRHWRVTCLDNIYIPLSSLKRLVNDEHSQTHLSDLYRELAITTRYVEASLVNHD